MAATASEPLLLIFTRIVSARLLLDLPAQDTGTAATCHSSPPSHASYG